MVQDKEIDIVKLEFPDNIRRRPGKEIGSTENPNVLLREAIDNSIDEIYGCSTCNFIYVKTKESNGWNIVADNGRGIPIRIKEGLDITMTELAVSHMDAGSKFNKRDSVAVGMNGHGIKATNALSNEFVICSRITEQNFDKSIDIVKTLWEASEEKKELFYFIHYQKGIKQEEGADTAETIKNKFSIDFPTGMSTITAFIPDDTIFKKTEVDFPSRNLKYLSFIAKTFYKKENVRVELNGNLLTESYEPFSNLFIRDITSITGYTIHCIVNFEFDKNLNNIDISGSVNSLPVDRGVHIELIKNAYRTALQQYFKISHNYLLYGIKLNIVVLAGEVDFSSQTKERLTYLSDIYSGDMSAIQELQKDFNKAFSENQQEWQGHVDRLNELYRSMVQISTIDRIKSMVNIATENQNKYRSSMPANVDDATSDNREECSLYVVEGDSAGGSMLNARDRRTDALFYLRGKPLNAVTIDQESLLNNREMNAIISAIGVGVDEYQIVDNPHFGKIIITTDADADGSNIASMLIAFFCARMQALVQSGRLYVVQTPLFIQGDKVAYLGDDIDSIIDKKQPFTRIKGLGELDPEELEKFVFNKESRKLLQITMENAQTAIDLMTSTYARKTLMVEKRIVRDPYNCGI